MFPGGRLALLRYMSALRSPMWTGMPAGSAPTAPVREDGELDGVALGLRAGGRARVAADLDAQVAPAGHVRGAAGLHHDGGDVVDQHGRPGHGVPRAQVLQQIRGRLLAAPHLRRASQQGCTCERAHGDAHMRRLCKGFMLQGAQVGINNTLLGPGIVLQ